MQLFAEKIEKFWNAWEVRALIQVSLILQVILIIFGARRKFTSSMMVRMLVWSAYLVADSVASIALGNLANSHVNLEDKKKSEPNNVLRAFWAPFLILHLGGPNTITAYSLEDNDLWLRHFLLLVVHVGLAFYVFLRSWSDTALTFIAIPIFITGIIKYGERTFVLRSSSIEHLRDSLLVSPAPDQAKQSIDPEAHYLVQASFLFQISACLFANLNLDYLGRNDPIYSLIRDKSAEDAFKLVEAELGFMFDALFTKATIVYSRLGIFLRCISFFSSISALIVFSIIIDIHAYPIADISLTYSLLVAAVFLEIYASILFMLSDWTKVWLIKLENADHSPMSKTLSHLLLRVASSFLSKPSKRRSTSIRQYNLIHSSVKNGSDTFIGVLINKLVDMAYRNVTWTEVSTDLQNIIFKQIQDNSNIVLNNFSDASQSLKQLSDRRGDYVLEKYYLNGFRWSTIGVEFDHSLLVWHIATDLCYYEDHKTREDEDHKTREDDHNLKISKVLSDYMLYLLVFCPSMLQKGISYKIRYRDTCNAIKRVVKPADESSTRKWLIDHGNNQAEDPMSVLHLGLRLAKDLRGLNSRKWKIISEVWMEMLVYAASHCAWKEHGQQLGKGGELLTHVSLVMAHFGLSEQYRMMNDPVMPESEWPDLF